jgi:8-oxo-dGTP diphosphatase
MQQTPVLAAGGIVVRSGPKPLVAVVQRRKDNDWVLPKGKLKPNEKPIAAARREVIEETGHDVEVQEFLGVISHQAGSGPKLVQFWRMQVIGEPVGKLMRDVKAVEWLPLSTAIERLSLAHEQMFLRGVGQRVLEPAQKTRSKPAPTRTKRALPRKPRPVVMPETQPAPSALSIEADEELLLTDGDHSDRAAAGTSVFDPKNEDAMVPASGTPDLPLVELVAEVPLDSFMAALPAEELPDATMEVATDEAELPEPEPGAIEPAVMEIESAIAELTARELAKRPRLTLLQRFVQRWQSAFYGGARERRELAAR